MGNKPSTLSTREAAAASPQDREIQDRGFIQLRSTHDVSVADAHIQKADQFVSDLQEAINAVTSTSNTGRYKEVHVMFLCWRQDKLGVKREIIDLSNVLSRMYRFETHHYEIHGEKPGRDTQSRIGQFLDEHDARDHLLILYYAGHAMPGRQGSEPPIWAESNEPGTLTMAAGGVQAVFEEAHADALLLYDSCHSAHPAINSSGHGVTEVIAAAGFELQAPTVGRDSFTHALIQALTQACRGTPFSATKLHEMALRWLKCRTRDHLRDQHGDIWTDPSGRPALQRTPTSTPVHCFLTEERPHRGIMLAPLPLRPSETRASIHSTSSSDASTLPLNSQTSSDSHVSSTTDLSDDLMSGTTNILLSVRLENDYFQDDNAGNVWTWREWIRNIPPGARAVKVEAIYQSASTLVLVSMPIAFWDALPDNPAYSFVGFVTSENGASTLQYILQDPVEHTRKMKKLIEEVTKQGLQSGIDLLAAKAKKHSMQKDDNAEAHPLFSRHVKRGGLSGTEPHTKTSTTSYTLAYEQNVKEIDVLRAKLTEGDVRINKISEELLKEVDLLAAELSWRDERIKEHKALLRGRSSKIVYLKDFLRTHGFRGEN